MSRSGLLRTQLDFRRFWIANALSQLGTQIGVLAVPLVAVSTLQATTLQIALLLPLQTLGFLLLGLQVGAWSDRGRRRPLMIAADLGRFLALTSVPLADLLGLLTIWHLYAVVLVCGHLHCGCAVVAGHARRGARIAQAGGSGRCSATGWVMDQVCQ